MLTCPLLVSVSGSSEIQSRPPAQNRFGSALVCLGKYVDRFWRLSASSIVAVSLSHIITPLGCEVILCRPLTSNTAGILKMIFVVRGTDSSREVSCCVLNGLRYV